jgi:hypothetical protein
LKVGLASLAALPALTHAVVTNKSAHLFACTSGGTPPTAILVLAQATLAAVNEFGSRASCGHCSEIIQMHEHCVIYIRNLPRRRLMLAQCESLDAIPALRSATRDLGEPASPVEVKQAAPVLDLSSALHAERSW